MKPGRVDRGLDGRLGARRNRPRADLNVRAAALGPPVGDVDFVIAAIHHGESVADLGTAGDVAEIVSPIGKDQGYPVELAQTGRTVENPRE